MQWLIFVYSHELQFCLFASFNLFEVTCVIPLTEKNSVRASHLVWLSCLRSGLKGWLRLWETDLLL